MRTMLLTMLCVLAISCENNTADQCDELTDCNGDCLFAYQDQEGMAMFLRCYDRWGVVYTAADGYFTGLIPDDMPSAYQTDSMRVTLCGYARENTIPLAFPDPLFNNIYQTEVVYIEEVE